MRVPMTLGGFCTLYSLNLICGRLTWHPIVAAGTQTMTAGKYWYVGLNSQAFTSVYSIVHYSPFILKLQCNFCLMKFIIEQ